MKRAVDFNEPYLEKNPVELPTELITASFPLISNIFMVSAGR